MLLLHVSMRKPANAGWLLLAPLHRLQNKEKVNNAVLFEKPQYDKMMTEVPKYKMITPVSDAVFWVSDLPMYLQHPAHAVFELL